jgi:formylglycine-generating enzyme
LFSYFLNENECDSIGQIDGLPVIDLSSPYTKIFQSRTDKKFYANTGFENLPVVNVTWIGAQMFSNAAQTGDLKIKLSRGFTGGASADEHRLPSEAEWEYAARGGVYATRFYIGANKDDIEYEYLYAGGKYMGQLGFFVDNSQGYCHVGGRFKPNELGLYDMSGNMWEWCYDKYKKDFLARNGTSNNPINVEGGGQRVAKGGSWSSDAMYCRITNRNYHNQFSTNPYLGFRLRRKW